jgi:hypothetical protein
MTTTSSPRSRGPSSSTRTTSGWRCSSPVLPRERQPLWPTTSRSSPPWPSPCSSPTSWCGGSRAAAAACSRAWRLRFCPYALFEVGASSSSRRPGSRLLPRPAPRHRGAAAARRGGVLGRVPDADRDLPYYAMFLIRSCRSRRRCCSTAGGRRGGCT